MTALCGTARGNAATSKKGSSNRTSTRGGAKRSPKAKTQRLQTRKKPPPKPAMVPSGPPLPGSTLPSSAPVLREGESHRKRVQRMVIDDFDFDTPPKPSKGANQLSGAKEAFAAVGMKKLCEADAANAKSREEARNCFAQAVLTFPKDAECLYNMGLFYEIDHKPEMMIRWMDLAIEMNPKHAMAWVLRSKYMDHIGRSEEALSGYAIAKSFSPDPHGQAESQEAELLRNQKIRIKPSDAWSLDTAAAIAGDGEHELHATLPPWQENFHEPGDEVPPKQPLLDEGVMAWDGVLSEELLTKLEDVVDDYYRFVFTNGWVYSRRPDDQGALGTLWLPAEATPSTAPELAARCLLERILQEKPDDYTGIEFWGRVRSESLGASFHYDTECCPEKDLRPEWVHGNPWRARWSSVLYLTDEGGPTVVLGQRSSPDNASVPAVPQQAHLVMPKRNRLVVFRADLFHGVLPVDVETDRMRKIFVFNWWRRHVPSAPHCQQVDLARHSAMHRQLLHAGDLSKFQRAEASMTAPPRPLERQRFTRRSEMPHSTDFGYMPQPLPMPTAQQLHASTGLCQIDWAAAASNED